MKNITGIGQCVLRLALGIGFIIPVIDRLGFLGVSGSTGVTWGDWKHFIDYTQTLVPFTGRSIANIIGGFATLSEFVLGILLIVGFRIKEAALGAGILTFSFGFCMAVFVGINAPFSYPVFIFTGGALVLSGLDRYDWSIDNYIKKNLSN